MKFLTNFLPKATFLKFSSCSPRIKSLFLIVNSPKLNMSTKPKSKYLSQVDAAALDQDLFNEYRYSVAQLMELAGFSCAAAIRKTYNPNQHRRVLVVCGPGNNGGDGLVAARHLAMMGFDSHTYVPKLTALPLYQNLAHQCLKHGIQSLTVCPTALDIDSNYDIVVDALFGFSFKPPIRDTMVPIMTALADTKIPCCSIDIPSGWNVDNGPPADGPIIRPSLLISLSAPKNCVKHYDGIHFLGGRFLPPGIIEKYNLDLPAYPDADQVVFLEK